MKVTANGSYNWELLLDIDNSDNAGVVRREIEIKTSIFSSYNEMKKSLQSEQLAASMGYDLGGTFFEIVKAEVKGEVSAEIRSSYEDLSEHRREFRQETTKTDVYEVGPHSKLQLYRLIFKGPGVHYATDTLSSTPHSMPDVEIDLTVKQLQVLQDMEIEYTDDSISHPQDMIQMAQGDNGDINAGFGGVFVWLVPRWTTQLSDGATGIQVVTQGEENSDYIDLAKGAGGDFRYVKVYRTDNNQQRITKIALYRTASGYDDPKENGWEHKSIDINRGRGGDYLYLVWNTKSIEDQ